MVTNTVALPQEVWSTVQSDIMRVQALSNAASLLSGNSGSLISRLQNASAYASQAGSLANIPGQLTGYQQTIGNNLSTMGKTLGMQQGMETNNAALLATLQQHSQSADRTDAGDPGGQRAGARAGDAAHADTGDAVRNSPDAGHADGRGCRSQGEPRTPSLQHFNSAPQVATGGHQQW